MYTKIIGTGSYLSEQVRTNADLEKMVDTSDEWIVTRTGIRERHIAAPNETVSTMGFEAATRAIEMAGIEKDHSHCVRVVPRAQLDQADQPLHIHRLLVRERAEVP